MEGRSGTATGGVTAPRQEWDNAPSVKDNVAFYDIMNNFFQPQYYRWDAVAQAAYLSIDKPGSSEDAFVSYDDVRACEQKIRYAVDQRLGGIFIWELGGGWRPTVRPSDPLLRAVKESMARIKR